jgi:hypothetical protein
MIKILIKIIWILFLAAVPPRLNTYLGDPATESV